MSQQMTNPELNSVHSVKILLCYILDKLNRPVTENQLRMIAEDSGIINYFFLADAVEELITNGSVTVSPSQSADGSEERCLSLTEKGRLGSEYFNRSIPLVFRKTLLQAAFAFFIKEQNEGICRCHVEDTSEGCIVSFKLSDTGFDLIDMNFYAPDRQQGEMIAEKIKANPSGAYKHILGYLLDNTEETLNIEKYL